MLNGLRSSASFSGGIRTCANCPGWMSGAICGADRTRRKYEIRVALVGNNLDGLLKHPPKAKG